MNNSKLSKAISTFFLIGIVGCTTQNTTQKVDKDAFSYAELSTKKNGSWEGKKYVGGSFENVTSLTLPSTHTDHSYFIRYEGPGLENNQIAYRLYLDWRNATDVFGKKKKEKILPTVGQDGFDSYHLQADWGLDLLKVGKSLGIGSFGRYNRVNDDVLMFQNVESTKAKIINLPHQSSVKIDYKGWQTLDDKIDLQSQLTIFPYDRFVKVDLKTNQTLDALCTGIVRFKNIPFKQGISKNQKWGFISTYGNQTLTGENDTLGMAIIYPIDKVDEIREQEHNHLVIFKSSQKEISYYFLAAWSEEPNGLSNKSDFDNDLQKKLDLLDQNGKL